MYYNIAQRILTPTFRRNYELITGVTTSVQETLNAAAGIGIKAQVPAFNQNKLDGIINRVSSEASFDDVAWILQEPVVNFSQSVVDDAIQENAEFQAGAGLKPKIIRRAVGKCCAWCSNLAGTYSYPDVPKDVYRRHENCRCTVEYDPGNSKRQNVHTKQWTTDEETATIEARKFIGLSVNGVQIKSVSNHVIGRMQERNVLPESILNAIQNPLDVGKTKIDASGRRSFRIIGKKATIYQPGYRGYYNYACNTL